MNSIDAPFFEAMAHIKSHLQWKAFKLSHVCPVMIEAKDLYQEAMIAAYYAYARYEPRIDVLLRTFLYRRAMGAMLDHIRDHRWSSRYGSWNEFVHFSSDDDSVERGLESWSDGINQPEAALVAKQAAAQLIARTATSTHRPHLKILELLLEGKSNAEIALETKLDPARVSRIVGDLKSYAESK